MKLLRYGIKGNERPAVLDKNGKIRNLSSYVSDFGPENINLDTLAKLQKIDFETLPEVSNLQRIGPCIAKPGKFVAIGLNYSDHAAETGAEIPTEPIVFMKATSSITGPNDNIIIPKNSKKTDWEVEIGFVIGKKALYVNEDDALDHVLGFFLV